MWGNLLGPLLAPIFALLPPVFILFSKLVNWKTKILWFFIALIIPWILKFSLTKFHYFILGYEWSSAITIVWCMSAFAIYGYFKKQFKSPDKPLLGNDELTFFSILIIFLLFILFMSKPLPTIYLVDYKPSEFKVSLKKPFFYSIDNTLRYGQTIDKKNPVLFEANFSNKKHSIYVSPDNQKAAVAIDKKLWLITLNKTPKLLLENVNTQGYNNIEVGEKYFNHYSLQWSKNSNSIYAIQYTRIEQISKQYNHNKLVHIDLDTLNKTNINVDRIFLDKYYFVGKDAICFKRAPGDGSVTEKCLYQNEHIDIKTHNKDKVVLVNDVVLDGKTFLSKNLYGETTLSSYGFYGKYVEKGIFGFYSKQFGEKPILKINTSYDVIKGHTIKGIRFDRSMVFSDQRHALLYVKHYNSYKLLLIDGQTGKYKELPNNIRVYRTFNSSNYKYFKINDSDDWPEFKPPRKFVHDRKKV